MLNIVILPGSVRHPEERIVEKFGINHISTGMCFVLRLRRGTELGKTAKGYIDQSQLLPDELIIDILASTLDSFKESKGVILMQNHRPLQKKKMLPNVDRSICYVGLGCTEEELMTCLIKRGQNSTCG